MVQGSVPESIHPPIPASILHPTQKQPTHLVADPPSLQTNKCSRTHHSLSNIDQAKQASGQSTTNIVEGALVGLPPCHPHSLLKNCPPNVASMQHHPTPVFPHARAHHQSVSSSFFRSSNSLTFWKRPPQHPHHCSHFPLPLPAQPPPPPPPPAPCPDLSGSALPHPHLEDAPPVSPVSDATHATQCPKRQ